MLINCLKYGSSQELKSSLADSKSKVFFLTVLDDESTLWINKETIYTPEVLKKLR